MSPDANRPRIGLLEVLSTCACVLICRPPNVKVMPPVTAYAQYGGLSMVWAQLDFLGGMPSVHLPSNSVASSGMSWRIELLNSLTVGPSTTGALPSLPESASIRLRSL